MRKAQQALYEFHQKFGSVYNNVPTVPDKKTLQLRVNLIKEEAAEFEEAANNQDLIEMADAIADILYVTLGAACALGVDAEALFNEVHRSNMTKVWADGSVRKREADGKILKPPTYSPADIEKVLFG